MKITALLHRTKPGFAWIIRYLRRAHRLLFRLSAGWYDYDFLDFGASKGGSIDYAIKRLGGRHGLGVDNNPEKIRQMRAQGYACTEGDITSLDFPGDSVRFVTISHTLEHLRDLVEVRKTLESAAKVATDFLFIKGPYFDADSLLKAQGLKFYWSDWSGHPCHLTTGQLREILQDLGLDNYAMMAKSIVEDSSHGAIHPLNSPRNQHEYIPGRHPPKPFVVFDPPLYEEIVCFVQLRDSESCKLFWEKSLVKIQKNENLQNIKEA